MKRCKMAKPSPRAASSGSATGPRTSRRPGSSALVSGLLVSALVAGSPAAAAPGQVYTVRHPVYACANPRVMLALSGDAGPLHPEGWAELERVYGRCTMLTPSTRLELVARQGRLMLLRRLPVHRRELMLFVPASQVAQARPVTAPAATTGQAAPLAGAAPPVVGGGVPEGGPVRSGVPAPAEAPPPTSAPAPSTLPRTVPSTTAPATAAPATTAPATAAPATSAPSAPAPSPPAPAAPSASAPAGPAAIPSAPETAAPPPPAAPGFDGGSPQGAAPVPDDVAPPASVPQAGTGSAGPVAGPDRTAPPPAAGSPTVTSAGPTGAPAASPVAPTPSGSAAGTPPVIQTAPPAAAPAPWPPTAGTAYRTGHTLLIGLLVLLLMAASVGVAWLVARRRQHFTRVEEDWPSPERPLGTPVAEVPPLPSPHAFRTLCASALEQAGWSTRIAFPGDGTGPDIVGRRDKTLLVVRCRTSRSVIGSEMINEAATMGGKQPGSLVVLASNAAFSQAARDEAARQRVHLLRDTDLYGFVG